MLGAHEKGPQQRPFLLNLTDRSVQVFANQTGQFKHGDLRFAKYGFELVISVDVAFVDFVLQVVFLDVDPHFAHHLGARHGA